MILHLLLPFNLYLYLWFKRAQWFTVKNNYYLEMYYLFYPLIYFNACILFNLDINQYYSLLSSIHSCNIVYVLGKFEPAYLSMKIKTIYTNKNNIKMKCFIAVRLKLYHISWHSSYPVYIGTLISMHRLFLYFVIFFFPAGLV